MTCLLIALVGLGLNSYRKMSLESLPSFDVPYVTVRTVWVGATPSDIEKDVAKRIDDAVSSLDGLKHVDSQCMENICYTTLEFNMGVDVDVAAVDVREKIDAILEDLPEDCERPVIEKVNINASAVVKLAITGDATMEEKYDYADNTLSDQFSTITGVGRVDIISGNEREVHIELDRQKMVAAGITTAEVIAAVKDNINTLPSGRVRDSGTEISVKFDAEYAKVEEINNFEVVSRNGIRRRISDLGRVFMTTDEVRQLAWFNGQPCVILSIVKKSEGNTVKTVNLCKARMEELNQHLPGGMHLEWISDDGGSVQASVDSTLSDIVSGIMLCAAILLFFLGNLRTTLIVCISMPLTIIISFFFMNLFGLTLNTITLLATGLSIGILVSNSIVVLENVVRRMEDTPNRWEAANKGTSEVAVSVLASAGTNVVVMLPIAMMTSMVGEVFRPFATTTLIVNIASIFISFTLTPILCACLLRPGQQRQTRIRRAISWWLGRIEALSQAYARALRWVANRRWLAALAVGVSLLLLFNALSMGGSLGFTFMEELDHGKIMIKLEYPVNYDLQHTAQRVRAVAERLEQFPDLINMMVTVGKVDSFGTSALEAVYTGQIQLRYKEKTEREWSIFERIDQIRELLSDEPGAFITVAVQSEMGGISMPITLNISGSDLDTLDEAGRKIKAIAENTAGTASIDSSVREGKPQLLISPRRTILQDVAMTSSTLGTILRGNLEGIKAATYKSGDRSFDIRVKYAEIPGKSQVAQFMIPGKDGQPVRLESIAEIKEHTIPVSIYRRDKSRIVQVIGTLEPGAKLQQVLNAIQDKIEEQEVLPAGYRISSSGDAEYMDDAIADFAEAIILASFLTFLTLAAILESFWRPFLILLTLPYGLIGVIWSLKLTGYGINIFVMLGVVMLIGVVVNAAVLIIDRFGQLRDQGQSPHSAMIGGAGESFRAVIMVILASALGMLPMATANGIGSELRVGIGVASFGGVLVAGVLTVFVLPLCYCVLTRKG